MEHISFSLLDKTHSSEILDELYDILYGNMSVIAPTGSSYEEDKQSWLPCIVSALENPQRKILLIYGEAGLAGLFMFSLKNETFLMEEIQFKPEYQGVGLFGRLYRYLFGLIPSDTDFVEAYAHKKNSKSQRILTYLGLQCIGENKSGTNLHFRGSYQELKEKILLNHCYCSHSCAKCVTYLATKNNDIALQEQARKFYKEAFGLDVSTDKLSCAGGRSDRVFELCKDCPFKKCCKERSIEDCSECPNYPCRELADYQAKYVNQSNQI